MLIAVSIAIVGLAVWRAKFGMSFQDDGYYAMTTIRLAQGARLFVDELFLQSLGFLAAVPFAKLWTSLFGMTGVVLALRLFYVAVAAIAAVIVYRLLRPSFGPWASLAGAAVPLLAPAYGLLSVTYDTMAALGLILGCAFAFAAVRDRRRWLAAAAGVATAFAAVSYPPLAVAAVALLVTLAVRSRDRRLVGAMSLGAAVVVALFAVWLLACTPVADLVTAFRFITGSWPNMPKSVHGARVAVDAWELLVALGQSWGLPLWVWFCPAGLASIVAWCAGRVTPPRARARGIALALLPVALALPVLADWAIMGRTAALWTLGGNYLIAFVLFASPPVFAGLWRRVSDRRDLALMALPVGLTGFVMVVLSSNASIHWASAIVGLAPLALAVVVCWIGEIAETAGSAAGAWATTVLLVAMLVLLFGSAFKDGAPLTLSHTIVTGAYAGITTDSGHASEVAELGRLAARWVGPSTTLTVMAMPGAYLVAGGVPVTDAVWLNPGPIDVFTVDYLDHGGRWPDVVLVPLSLAGQSRAAIAADPFLSVVASRYRLVERSAVAGVAVYSRVGAP